MPAHLGETNNFSVRSWLFQSLNTVQPVLYIYSYIFVFINERKNESVLICPVLQTDIQCVVQNSANECR
jgi:hypothetical protein